MTHGEKMKVAIDAVTGFSVVSWPLWMQYVQMGVGVFMLFAGAILMGFRLMIAYRDWRRGK